MAYTITIEEVLNGITVTPPAANEVTVSTTNYPITISYNAVEIEGATGQGVPEGGTTGQVLTKSSSDDYDTEWTTLTDLVGINNVVEDTTPQLGGNLDVNGNKIVSTSNANVVIEPNGTGVLQVLGQQVIIGDTGGVYGEITSPSGAGIRVSPAGGGANQGAYYIYPGANGDIAVNPDGTGSVRLESDTVKAGKFGATATVTSYGAGNLTLNTNSGTNSGSITINQGANANIAITPNGTGKIVLDGLAWPNADGTANYVLKTNGSGTLSWANVNDLTAGVYLSSVQDDSAPTLGGNLSVNGYNIQAAKDNNVVLETSGTGHVVIDGQSFPNADGSAGQVLKTSGSGSLSWVDKQDPTIVNDSQPSITSTGQHWYRPVTGAFYTARSGNWDPINDDGYF